MSFGLENNNLLCVRHWAVCFIKIISFNLQNRDSLVVQWLRIWLPVQGTWVRSLVLDDSTCCWATKVREPQLLSSCSREATAMRSPHPAMRE